MLLLELIMVCERYWNCYIDSAANNLLKFKDKVDVEKCGEPAFLAVLTGTDYSYKRDDGVYVVSIGTLKN